MDTVNLQVKVDGFVQFGTGDWTLTGNTSYQGRNHLSNHWCTQSMKDSLTAAVEDFYYWTKSEGKALLIGVNDMSLEWGGAFDFPGTWSFNSEHSFHRIGLSVDIDGSNMTPGQLERLTGFMDNYDGERNSEQPQIHFGFNEGN